MARKILVVDDELPIQKLLEITLSRAGYKVILASDGIYGLEKLEEAPPDLVLLDIKMPRMDGYEMLKRMREDGRFKEIPVIILTALALDCEVNHGRNCDVSAYVTKPLSVDELLALIKRVDNGAEVQPQDVSKEAWAM